MTARFVHLCGDCCRPPRVRWALWSVDSRTHRSARLAVADGDSRDPNPSAGIFVRTNTFIAVLAVATLVACGDEPGAPGVDLSAAVDTGNVDAIEQYIAAGTDLNVADPAGGNTPLNLASVFGKTEVVQALIDGGANLEIKNNEGASPLYNASFFCHPKIVKALLEKGADVDTTNKHGTSLLEVMEADWNPALEGVYRFIFNALQIQRDLEDIKKTRPGVAKLLRENAAKNPVVVSTSPQPPVTKTVKLDRDLPPITAADWSSYNHDVRG